MFCRNVGLGAYRRWTNDIVQPGEVFEASEKEVEIMELSGRFGTQIQKLDEAEGRAAFDAQVAGVEEGPIEEVVEEPLDSENFDAADEAEAPKAPVADLGDAPEWSLNLAPKAYLAKYPKGQHAQQARAVLEYELRRAEVLASVK